MALHYLYETPNFVVFAEDTGVPDFLGALTAEGVMLRSTLEADFNVLAGLFDFNTRFGDSANKIRVVIDPTVAQGTAQNQGVAAGGQTTISISYETPDFRRGHTPEEADDAIKGFFVAELAEILLSLRSHDGHSSLDRGSCDGEGFSLVMTAWLHPLGYNAYQYPDFRVVQWMNATMPIRDNYLGPPPYGHDNSSVANGCAIAFLYFLRYQMAYSWKEIVAAMGETLPETYVTLTGRQDGFDEMRRILDGVFPVGTPVTWQYDNPFPIGARDVKLTFPDNFPSDDPVFFTDVLDEGDVSIALCPAIGKRSYHFRVVRVPGEVDVTAWAIGFGNPVFDWTVSAQHVTRKSYDTTAIPVDTGGSGWDDDPRLPNMRRPHNGVVVLNCGQSDTIKTRDENASSTLSMVPASPQATPPGHFYVNFGVTVRESSLPDASVTGYSFGESNSERIDWDENYKRDVQTCSAIWHSEMVRLEIRKDIILLLTLPDPPVMLRRSIALLEHLNRELEILRQHSPELAKKAEGALAALRGTPLRLGPA